MPKQHIVNPKTTEFSTATPNYSSLNLLRDLLAWLRPYRGRFIFASLARLSSDVTNLYPAYALGVIVTLLSKWSDEPNPEKLWLVFWLMVAVYIWRPIAQGAAKLIGYRTGARVAINAQYATLSHLARLDMTWHEKENAGNKMRRVQRGGDSVDRIFKIWFMRIIEMSVSFVGMTWILTVIDPVIGITVLIFIATFFTISFFFTKRGSYHAHRTNIQDEHVLGLAFETVNNIRTVKALGMLPALQNILSDAFEELNGRIRRKVIWFQSRGTVLALWAYSFRMGLYAYIILGVISGRYDIGFLVLFTGYFIRLWMAASELAESTHEFIVSKYGIARMQDILNEPLGIDSDKGKSPLKKDWQELSIKGVSFSYGDIEALGNISFSVKRGERVGIVGLSGAGKSTLMKLLLKENEDYSGTIKFDGVPLKDITRTSYFAQAAAVLQDTELFNLSLRENITLVSPDAFDDDERFMEAVETAHVTEFMNKLPDGEDSIVGEKGIKLSGGEKQRVGLARAVFKRPEILFLDEATSHLDLESEQKIQDALAKLFSKVTALVIAHRLTTIKEMDRILVIEDGHLIEEGNFKELMGRGGRFKKLWDMQQL